ncbi:MAG: class I SAM-dependent methyltransferase [Oscillospiraceae bacterium]|jgi:ubiquinone/menaquinone biosynthesis C-methylase UbiE|nr:class I SAM-dependent methyltransferase [Oscillospiraceae bacterium]
MKNSYIESNKTAWEEAFDNRQPNWGDNNHIRLKNGRFEFFDSDMRDEVSCIDLKGKNVAQFCCNNGRELLSLVLDSGAAYGTGFDIAENILNQAKQTAEKAGITNCEFVNCNILEIPEKYYGEFDLILFTIGAICWFQDLTLLFEKVGKCLKNAGMLLINDGHPVLSMLPMPGEDEYDPNNAKLFHSYFRKEPWIGTDGMGYMSVEYESKPFTDFSYTMSDIVNALSVNGMKTIKLNEYDYDIGMIGSDVYDKKGIPLSYILVAEKNA